MDISWNIKSILKHSFCVLFGLIAFCLVATEVAEAKTISNNNSFVSDSQYKYFDNLFKRSDYKYYLLGADTSDSYYNNYYLCLSNEINVTSAFNASAKCEEMYRYYRNNNTYSLEKVNDNELEFKNSVYYINNIYDTNYLIHALLFIITIFIVCFLLVYIIFKMLR